MDNADEIVPMEGVAHHPSHDAIEDIKRRAGELISNEKIDKDAAIGVLKLLHDLETLVLHAHHEKERENQKLRNQLEVSRLTQKHAEMLESLSADMTKLRRDSETRDGELKRMDSNIQQVAGALNNVSTKKR